MIRPSIAKHKVHYKSIQGLPLRAMCIALVFCICNLGLTNVQVNP